MSEPDRTFAELMAVLADRKRQPSNRSYTKTLLDAGLDKIAAKLREETDEVIAAAGEPVVTQYGHVVHEAADVLYHLFVLLTFCEVDLADVAAELARRSGRSGLDEKASRTAGRERPPGQQPAEPS
ncbi:MAG: phosphoribosyl-ATP diphosphatase [Pirellulales bacterium]